LCRTLRPACFAHGSGCPGFGVVSLLIEPLLLREPRNLICGPLLLLLSRLLPPDGFGANIFAFGVNCGPQMLFFGLTKQQDFAAKPLDFGALFGCGCGCLCGCGCAFGCLQLMFIVF
jgi:hypothetical protein